VIRPKQPKSDHVLLTTVTGEPFQPTRLYWSIPSRHAVTRILTALRCVVEESAGRTWVWLYQDEATAITFGKPYAEISAELHPIHIGRFKLPQKDRLVLEVRSFERAIEAAKFFAPLFGTKVVLRRARVINRLFEGHEVAAGPDVLDRLLDQNVVVKDPRQAEEAFERAMAGARTSHEKQQAFLRYSDERRQQDVPLVEDFPLCPEEETPEFRDLTMTLRLRQARAMEHWNGNPVTLADLIHRTVEQGVASGAIKDVPVEFGPG
jgi:hypothetical protein